MGYGYVQKFLSLFICCLVFSQTSYGKDVSQKPAVDLIIFSYDRPMQLYAYLESIDKHLKHVHKTFVLYRTSTDSFDDGYQEVKKKFSQVTFVQQTRSQSGDFKPLLLHLCFKKSKTDYVMFGVDDIIVTRPCDLETCLETLQETNNYGFYVRLGKNIRTHYGLAPGQTFELPVLKEVKKDVFEWTLKSNDFFNPWHYPHSVDMTIFKKNTIKDALKSLVYTSPNTFEFVWSRMISISDEAKGLCFDKACMVNIPLNLVQEFKEKHMNFATPAELLARFIKGEKIDVDAFFMYENKSPHEDLVPRFIAR